MSLSSSIQNFDSNTPENTQEVPSSNESTQVSKDTTTEATQEKIQELLDLDKVERFRFAGKEWTPKELSNSYMMRSDYTKKTQEVAEARKYAENFEADLKSVMDDPNLFDKFKGLYPKFYVELASKMLERASSNPTQNDESKTSTQFPPELEKRINGVESFISRLQEDKQAAELNKAETWLDNTFSKMTKKYPNADDLHVTVAAEQAHLRGDAVDEKLLERLFKDSHEKLSTKFETYHKSKVTEQTKANEKSKDVGAGGGIVGQAPVKHGSIKSAKSAWLDEISSNR